MYENVQIMRAKKCLVVTPASNYGSWTWLEDLFRSSPSEISWRVLTYGNPAVSMGNVKIISLPSFEYIKTGRFMSRRGLRWMNILYSMPLGVICLYQVIRFRPKAILCNGFACSAIPSLVGRLMSIRVVVAFHSFTGEMGQSWRRVISWFSALSNLVVVNSEGSADDLRDLVAPEKLMVVYHWADRVFFETPIREATHDRPKTVLYVGRLDSEKCLQFVRVMSKLSDGERFKASVVGNGELEAQVRKLVAVDWRPYISDRRVMAELMSSATIVWAPADTTYLSRPGIESLASGTPVIVSDIPALAGKVSTAERIPRDLVPRDVGWVVEGSDDREALELLKGIGEAGIPLSQREACRRFAEDHHGPQTVSKLIAAILG